jgi:hypothetical protein
MSSAPAAKCECRATVYGHRCVKCLDSLDDESKRSDLIAFSNRYPQMTSLAIYKTINVISSEKYQGTLRDKHLNFLEISQDLANHYYVTAHSSLTALLKTLSKEELGMVYRAFYDNK